MKELDYQTVATSQHSVTVKTWREEQPGLHYTMWVDGQALDTGLIPEDD